MHAKPVVFAVVFLLFLIVPQSSNPFAQAEGNGTAVSETTTTFTTTSPVAELNTTLMISCVPNYVVTVGEPVKCVAVVSPSPGLSVTSPPSGNVTWATEVSNGSRLFLAFTGILWSFCSQLQNEGGVGLCNMQFRPDSAGWAFVMAFYQPSGNSPYLSSNETSNITVALRTSSTVFSCDRTRVNIGKTIQCTATVWGYYPTGFVSWTVTGAGSVALSSERCELTTLSTKGSCSIKIKGTTVGAVAILATYSGDYNNTSSSVTYSKLAVK